MMSGSKTAAAGQPRPKTKARIVLDNILSLAFALLIVFMIRSSIVEAFKIPSGSMIPTLLVGDHIFVNKFSYGLKIPFTDLLLDQPIYIWKREAPKRGDIVVFMYPRDESLHYIKRVIGVPGDTIEIREKMLYINKKPVSRVMIQGQEVEHALESLEEPRYNSNQMSLYDEALPRAGSEEKKHWILLSSNHYMGEDFGPITVPEENLFVMGDNRDFSNDSRFWGFVPYKNVKGRAMVIWLSLWISFQDSKFTFKPGRIGTLLR